MTGELLSKLIEIAIICLLAIGVEFSAPIGFKGEVGEEAYEEEEKREVLEEYKKEYTKNKDLAGYITLPNDYSYPIMYTPYEQNYYLDHNFNKQKDSNGLPFLHRDSAFGEQGISLVYGHTLKSGKAFSVLKKYTDEKYLNKHKTMEINTIYEKATYEVQGVILTSLDNQEFNYYDYIGKLSEEDFNTWKTGMSKQLKTGNLDEIVYEDTIIELSTCAYHVKDGRLVVILKRIEVAP